MFPVKWRVKDIFSYNSSTQVWSSAAKGILVLFSSKTSLRGSQIPLNTMHVRAGRAKNCAFAFNPHVILFLLTPVAWGVKILDGKGGSSLASSLMGFTEHEEVCEKLGLTWLPLQHSCLGAFLRAPTWWGEQERNKENQAGQAVIYEWGNMKRKLLIFINQVVNLLHVMKGKHQYC